MRLCRCCRPCCCFSCCDCLRHVGYIMFSAPFACRTATRTRTPRPGLLGLQGCRPLENLPPGGAHDPAPLPTRTPLAAADRSLCGMPKVRVHVRVLCKAARASFHTILGGFRPCCSMVVRFQLASAIGGRFSACFSGHEVRNLSSLLLRPWCVAVGFHGFVCFKLV